VWVVSRILDIPKQLKEITENMSEWLKTSSHNLFSWLVCAVICRVNWLTDFGYGLRSL
jgi:hypothetical protein